MGNKNTKDKLLQAIKQDNENEIKNILNNEPKLKNEYINKNNDHTGLCMAAYFGSLNATKALVELGNDINQSEKREGSTPLIIAAKRNEKSMVKFLMENGAEVNHRNNLNLNALDYSIIHGNYEIAFNFLLAKENNNLKSMDEYIELNKKLNVPCFNIPLFYQNLADKIEPKSVPSFHLTNEELKNLEGKMPDPDETWSDFFKRVMNFKLYQPPLVDIDSVPLEKRQSTFVRVQTKLLEIEFNKTISLEDNKNDIEKNHNIELSENSTNVIKIAKKDQTNIEEMNAEVLDGQKYNNDNNLQIHVKNDN